MSNYYYNGNERFNNIFKGIDLPTYNLNHVHAVANNLQNSMEPMVKLNHRIIPGVYEDMSRAYAARDLGGINTSNQKIPDSLVLDKNPITRVPQRPFFIQV